MAVKFNDQDEIVFTSGRRRYCHSGMFGLCARGRIRSIGYGEDGEFYDNQERESALYEDDQDGLALYPEDIAELADMMIERWTELKIESRRAAGGRPKADEI